MRHWLAVSGLLSCALLSACATIPPVTVNYYLPQAQTTIQVIETVACDADGTKIFAIQAVTPTTAYFADPARPASISMRDLSHWYADTSETIKLTPDGRLQSINGTTTGSGEGLVKSVVGTMEALLPLAAAAKAPATVNSACTVIQKAGAGKPVTLTYNLAEPIHYKVFNKDLSLLPDPPSTALDEQLKDFIPVLVFHIGPQPAAATRTLIYAPTASDDVLQVKVTDTGNVELTLTASMTGQKPVTAFDQFVTTPLPTDYFAPIPRGAFFGTRVGELDFDGSGAITQVTYNKSGGATDTSTAIGDVATPLAPKTAAQKASDIQAQADLIAQQQRLMTCRTDPSGCK